MLGVMLILLMLLASFGATGVGHHALGCMKAAQSALQVVPRVHAVE